MPRTQYARLDEKMDQVLAAISEVRTDVAILKTHRSDDCGKLSTISESLKSINGRVGKNEKKIAWIIGVGSGAATIFAAAKAWLKV